MSIIIENREKLKELRRDLKDMGYKIKTHNNSLGTFGEIYFKNSCENYEVLGSCNVYPKIWLEIHKKLFKYMERYNYREGYLV